MVFKFQLFDWGGENVIELENEYLLIIHICNKVIGLVVSWLFEILRNLFFRI